MARCRGVLACCLLACLAVCCSGGPVSEEDESTNEVVPLEILLKRAVSYQRYFKAFNSRFNMGKKFGGYSWLRSADSTMRRLQYYFGNKQQQQQREDEYNQQEPALQKEVYWENN
ncbi:uncharacterized protein LOC134537167 [Bacillus rossius redtenbacheri]|uniref:uncharacterized protein LOC134537167 n=1 Tax=Bacillus rossius redtenbacheri TaxID=93214 RepID=UPI002FDDC5DB